MKNFKKIAIAAIVVAIIGCITYSNQKSTTFMSNLGQSDIEALASDESWWDRKDYNCVTVTCNCIFYSYSSDVAEYAGDGNGSVAHTWNCSGCGSCGWS